MIYTTLNRVRACVPSANGWKTLMDHLGKTQADDEPLAMTVILDSIGIDDALWCLRAEPQHGAIWHLLAVHYGRQVQHLMTDPRSLSALEAERDAARDAALDKQAADLRTVLEHYDAAPGCAIHGWSVTA
jgi:hypothetical protein